MRKILCLVMCLIMVLGCVACSNETPPVCEEDTTESTNNITENTQNGATNESTTESTEPPTEPTVKVPETFNIQLSFAGDCMLATYKDQMSNGSFNEYAKNNPPEYFLEKVKHIFEADDFTTVNLENVFTDSKVTEVPKSGDRVFWFKSKTSNVNILTSSSVEGVSLANNHTNDYGTTGFNDTKATVENAGLKYGTNNDKIIYYEKEGFKVAVICSGLWGESGANAIIKKIKEAEEVSDYQIVFYHGGTEKIHHPEEWKQRASRKLIDNGADLVIGNHPHVLQPREIYNGKEIIYSLGNFCYGGHRQPQNRTIIYQMNLTINKEDLSLKESISEIIPCYVYTETLNNYQPAPIEIEEVKQRVLDFMDGKLDNPY